MGGGIRRAAFAAMTLLVAASASACSRSDAGQRPRGDALFASACARCHGADGAGGPPVANGASPRNFRDHAFHASRSDADIRRTITSGTPTGMPPFAGVFDDAQLAALVAYVRTFDPEPAKAERGSPGR